KRDRSNGCCTQTAGHIRRSKADALHRGQPDSLLDHESIPNRNNRNERAVEVEREERIDERIPSNVRARRTRVAGGLERQRADQGGGKRCSSRKGLAARAVVPERLGPTAGPD